MALRAKFKAEHLRPITVAGDTIPWVVHDGDFRCNGDGTMSAQTYQFNRFRIVQHCDTSTGSNPFNPPGYLPFIPIHDTGEYPVKFPFGSNYPFYGAGGDPFYVVEHITGVELHLGGLNGPQPFGDLPFAGAIVYTPEYYSGVSGSLPGGFSRATDYIYGPPGTQGNDSQGRFLNGLGQPVLFEGIRYDPAIIGQRFFDVARYSVESQYYFPPSRVDFPVASCGVFRFTYSPQGVDVCTVADETASYRFLYQACDAKFYATGGNATVRFTAPGQLPVADGGGFLDPFAGKLSDRTRTYAIKIRLCPGKWDVYVDGVLTSTAYAISQQSLGRLIGTPRTLGFEREDFNNVTDKGSSWGDVSFLPSGQAQVKLTPTTGDAPLEVTLTGFLAPGQVPGTPGLTLLSIDWGDGSDREYSRVLPLKHTFETEGIFTVVVKPLVVKGVGVCGGGTFQVSTRPDVPLVIDPPLRLLDDLNGRPRAGDVRFFPRGL